MQRLQHRADERGAPVRNPGGRIMTTRGPISWPNHHSQRTPSGAPMTTQATLVAKQIRSVLTDAYPDTKFSVRHYKHARSTTFVVSWMEGPSEESIKPKVELLARSVPFGSLYCSRGERWMVAS